MYGIAQANDQIRIEFFSVHLIQSHQSGQKENCNCILGVLREITGPTKQGGPDASNGRTEKHDCYADHIPHMQGLLLTIINRQTVKQDQQSSIRSRKEDFYRSVGFYHSDDLGNKRKDQQRKYEIGPFPNSSLPFEFSITYEQRLCNQHTYPDAGNGGMAVHKRRDLITELGKMDEIGFIKTQESKRQQQKE